MILLTTFLLLLHFVGCALSLNSNSDEKINPLMLKMRAAHELYVKGQNEEALESLRDILTTFNTDFGEDPKSLSTLCLMNFSTPETPSEEFSKSPNKPEKLFFLELVHTAAKDVFGPFSDNTLAIILHLGPKLFKAQELDKAFETAKILAQGLETSLEKYSNSDFQPNSNSNSTWSKQQRTEILLRVLHNLGVLHLKFGNYREAAETYTKIYETQKIHGAADEEQSKKNLEKLVGNLELVTKHRVNTQLERLFWIFKDSWKMENMTALDFNKHLWAYEAAFTSVGPNEAYEAYKDFMGINVDSAFEDQTKQTELNLGPENAKIALKFDEDVYDILFNIHRLVASTAKMAEMDSDYPKYKQMAENNRDKDIPVDVHAQVKEEYSRLIAPQNQYVAKERVKDILKQTEEKFGTEHYKTRGAAHMFAILFRIVGMTEEATNIQTKFGIPDEDILATMNANIKNSKRRDEL